MASRTLRYPVATARRMGKNLIRSRLGLRRLAGFLTWRRRMRPHFLILGAQKAGTTALFGHLCSCLEMAPPERFELHYFDTDYWRGLRWYLSHFPMAGEGGPPRISGEKSPYYLFHPSAPIRVKATLPEARLIVLLRNPVDRTYSHFRHSREQGFEDTATFEEALELEEARLAGEERKLTDPRYTSFPHQHFSYLTRSLYADQIERWLRHFPREQLLAVQSEALWSRPDEVMEEVFTFLGIEGKGRGVFKPRNVGGYTSTLSPDTRAELEGVFAPHNERLFELLGRRFDW